MHFIRSKMHLHICNIQSTTHPLTYYNRKFHIALCVNTDGKAFAYFGRRNSLKTPSENSIGLKTRNYTPRNFAIMFFFPAGRFSRVFPLLLFSVLVFTCRCFVLHILAVFHVNFWIIHSSARKCRGMFFHKLC